MGVLLSPYRQSVPDDIPYASYPDVAPLFESSQRTVSHTQLVERCCIFVFEIPGARTDLPARVLPEQVPASLVFGGLVQTIRRQLMLLHVTFVQVD